MPDPLTPLKATWASECTLRVDMTGAAPETVREAVQALSAAGVSGMVDVVPGAAAVLVVLACGSMDPTQAEAQVGKALADLRVGSVSPVREVEIPFCADADFALDLSDLAAEAGLRPDDVLERFLATEFTARFLGFMPGFAYLDGLPSELRAARRATPRALVPSGSVGIGGEHAGVYPSASPGGWRIIGRTPRKMFDPTRSAPSVLEIGDRVRFRAISQREFDAWREGDA